MEAMQPRICIQPQSRRSPRYYITMIIRAPSRVFQFQDSQHSFQDCMDYILPGLHWKCFTTPCRRQHHCSLHCVAFPYLTAYLQVFFLFIFFDQIAPGRTVTRHTSSACFIYLTSQQQKFYSTDMLWWQWGWSYVSRASARCSCRSRWVVLGILTVLLFKVVERT